MKEETNAGVMNGMKVESETIAWRNFTFKFKQMRSANCIR